MHERAFLREVAWGLAPDRMSTKVSWALCWMLAHGVRISCLYFERGSCALLRRSSANRTSAQRSNRYQKVEARSGSQPSSTSGRIDRLLRTVVVGATH